jgi:hypothetical protein
VIVVELAVVVGLVWALVSVVLWLLDRTRGPTLTTPAHWRVTHYDAEGETRVVLQKHDDQRDEILGQHLVGTIPLGDPDYEATFLAVMDSARQRRALFEAEEDR